MADAPALVPAPPDALEAAGCSESVTEFFENHLHVPVHDDGVFGFRADYGRTIRTHALGRFDQMLVAAITHPAMGTSLDNASSTKTAPNENLGRALLELHTVGRGNHTEDDVKDVRPDPDRLHASPCGRTWAIPRTTRRRHWTGPGAPSSAFSHPQRRRRRPPGRRGLPHLPRAPPGHRPGASPSKLAVRLRLRLSRHGGPRPPPRPRLPGQPAPPSSPSSRRSWPTRSSARRHGAQGPRPRPTTSWPPAAPSTSRPRRPPVDGDSASQRRALPGRRASARRRSAGPAPTDSPRTGGAVVLGLAESSPPSRPTTR